MICVFVSKIPRASKTPKAKPKYRRAKPKHNGLDGKGMLYANKLSRNKHGTGDADLLVVNAVEKGADHGCNTRAGRQADLPVD